MDHVQEARDLTTEFRESEDVHLRELRRLLLEKGLDPNRVILADLYPDDFKLLFGVLIAPDGTPHTFDLDWASGKYEFASWTSLARPSDWWPYTSQIFAGLVIFEELHPGLLDPLDALVEEVRSLTELLRTGKSGLKTTGSLRSAVANSGLDPSRVALIDHIQQHADSFHAALQTLTNVHVFEGRISDEAVDHVILTLLEGRNRYGPIVDAANRFLQES